MVGLSCHRETSDPSGEAIYIARYMQKFGLLALIRNKCITEVRLFTKIDTIIGDSGMVLDTGKPQRGVTEAPKRGCRNLISQRPYI